MRIKLNEILVLKPFNPNRPDPDVPIELSFNALVEFVKCVLASLALHLFSDQSIRAGKVKYLGVSECSAQSVRRAHAIYPITAMQVEYSPFILDIEHPSVGLVKTARELGIKIVAYSPLGRGILSGAIVSWESSIDRLRIANCLRFLEFS